MIKKKNRASVFLLRVPCKSPNLLHKPKEHVFKPHAGMHEPKLVWELGFSAKYDGETQYLVYTYVGYENG